MDKNKKLQKKRLRRRQHVRNKLRGTSEQPRMCINRSLKHFSCQVVDDLSEWVGIAMLLLSSEKRLPRRLRLPVSSG